MRVARFKIFDAAVISATSSQTSAAIDVSHCNGYFSIAGSVATAGATAKCVYYYQLSDDNTNWTANALATERGTAAYFIGGIDPAVSKYIRVVALGTSDNSASNTITTKLLITED